MFNAPIPGQSLTSTPRNAPWERPPEVVDPEEALNIHLDRLNQPDKLEALLDAIDMGLDVKTLTSGILRSAVATGIHTIDVGLIIAPILHEFIRSTAEIAGVEYDEGFEDKKAKEKFEYARTKSKALKKLREMGEEPVLEASPIEEEMTPMTEETPTPEASTSGFIQRRK